MADDIKVPDESAGSGPVVATDEIGGRHYQIVKLAIGADGSAALVGDAGLPISAAALPLPTGAAQEATLAALAALNDTMLFYLSAMLEKMPRLSTTDLLMAQIEMPAGATQTSVSNASSNPTSGAVTYRTNELWNFADAGASRLYDRILVT